MKNYIVRSYHFVSVDNYQEGEQEGVNDYMVDSTIQAETWQQAVNEYIANVLYYSLSITDCELSESGTLQTSITVDQDNSEATEEDIALWKVDKKVLYSNSFSISVSEITEIDLTTKN